MPQYRLCQSAKLKIIVIGDFELFEAVADGRESTGSIDGLKKFALILADLAFRFVAALQFEGATAGAEVDDVRYS